MRQLATMAGISNPYLSQIERGLREPSERVLEALARSLELSAEQLYEQAGVSRDEEETESDVERAVADDAQLSARQRRALTEIYRALLAENDARRPGGRRAQ
jgi:transcriptional regulator with XRE-family HTH domain